MKKFNILDYCCISLAVIYAISMKCSYDAYKESLKCSNDEYKKFLDNYNKMCNKLDKENTTGSDHQ